MSRRVGPPGPDRSEQNRATLKQLVKLEANKTCSDCKRNKHPRWASWNLGVFICIRCSGIHRGMGTHISRVKSVDLDSWTDEQLQSMVRWGNARANTYWEHKLAEGHVPNDAKMENFIRTKYDSKRWVMDGPMPDPATLDDGGADDELPLKIVQERARSGSGAGGNRAGIQPLPQAPRARPQPVDLFGDPMESPAAPVRPSTVEPATTNRLSMPKAPAAPAKSTKPGDSLLGLDFLGGSSSAAPARPSSTGPVGGSGRTDLKQSILSLYASKPAAPAQPPQQQPQASSPFGQFGGSQSQPQQTPQSNTQALSSLGDAFGSLSFGAPAQPTTSKAQAFPGFTSPTGQTHQQRNSALSGGSFFDAKPAPAAPAPTNTSRKESFGGDWGDFSSAASPPKTSSKPAPTNGSSIGDLFSLEPTSSTLASKPAPPKAAPLAKSPPPIDASKFAGMSSAFNLSSTAPSKPASTAAQSNNMSSFPTFTSSSSGFGAMSAVDAWGSNDAWATPDVPAQTSSSTVKTSTPTQINTSSFSPPAPKPAAPQISADFSGGWGDPTPSSNTTISGGGATVQQDDDFGGWSHASPAATTPAPAKTGNAGLSGGGGSDDLFGNVWG
ncbi:putative Arf GTPase activating protein [Acrodontium crateriforme]|uniref:Arf GTPase activating protein n=1 Tax=Acrodontium crateriforme TaxID=150365 RepID=A0AAQ3LZL8_9PEZI|nr:putative Arf GTPase activating protein [Acrodontium crateriforme]